MTMPLSLLKKVGTPITRNLVKMEAFQAQMGSQAQDQGICPMKRNDFWKQPSEEEEACESRSCMSTYFLVQTHHQPILSIVITTSSYTWKKLCTFMTFYICSSLQKTSCLPPIVSFSLFWNPCCMCLLVGFFLVSVCQLWLTVSSTWLILRSGIWSVLCSLSFIWQLTASITCNKEAALLAHWIK